MDFIERLQYYMTQKGINDNKITVDAGLSVGLIGKAKKSGKAMTSANIEKILLAYPDLNPNWLLTGKGEMINHESHADKSDCVISNHIETRPRIPFEAAAGALSLATQSITESQCERFPLIPGFAKYDFTIIVRGDSMEPEFRSGDELACQMLRERGYIQWGRPYIIDSVDGVVLKRIHDAGDEILCTSDNPRYGDFKIPKNEINHLALIVGMIRKF